MNDTFQPVPQVPADDQVTEQSDSQAPTIDEGVVEETKITDQPTASTVSAEGGSASGGNSQQSTANNQSPISNFPPDGNRQYDEEIKSDKIETPRKTFFLDLKANNLGRYVKISERSSGKRSTIIIPEETIGEFIQKIQKLFS